MKNSIDISEDISYRLDQLAARSSRTRGEIVEDALAHGRSLAWQERWMAGIEAGLAEAEKGDFVAEQEIAAVLNKYGPV